MVPSISFAILADAVSYLMIALQWLITDSTSSDNWERSSFLRRDDLGVFFTIIDLTVLVNEKLVVFV